jgi:tetratricopeptide (TPR) repeat protein
MDVRRTSVDETIGQAEKARDAGNYRGAVSLLQPLLKEKLSPQQERDVVMWLSSCYRSLNDYKAALPHAQRGVVLVQEVHGSRSLNHALALKGLCIVQCGLKDFIAARKTIAEALAIMGERALQQDEHYGGMLAVQGDLDRDQGRYKEALAVYDKAKAVLVQYKEGREYGVLVSCMTFCHKGLHQWIEAVACSKEYVEHSRNLHGTSHPEYATALHNLGVLLCDLKQYEEDIPRCEEALTIRQSVFGDKHEHTLMIVKELADARHWAQQSNRHLLDVGHEFRMCNQCGAVKEHMSKCDGCNRAWYCGPDCQLQHWPTHKPRCEVCLHCDTVLSKSLHCSRCKKGKYCNAECFKAHWSEHKKHSNHQQLKDCVAPK